MRLISREPGRISLLLPSATYAIISPMKTYEITIVMNPDLAEDVRKKALKKAQDLVEKNKGKVEKIEDMGKKELAYSIGKKTHGYYHFFRIQLEENKVAEIDRGLRLMEEFIRYLLIAVE